MRLGLIENGTISKLGLTIANLQVDPMQGLSIYYGYQLGCVKEVIAIMSMIDAMKGNINELFLVPKIFEQDNINSGLERNKQQFDNITKKFKMAKDSLSDTTGDHLTLLKIFTHYTKLRKEKNDQKLVDWMYKHFLKKSVLEKANKNYKKVKGSCMSKLKNDMSIDWNKHKQKTRILTAIFCGFFLNTMFLKDDKKKNILIAKDSFLKDTNEEVIYNELTTISGNTAASIVSKISKSIKDLYTEIPQ
jgi:HrpA-like RNA helicase